MFQGNRDPNASREDMQKKMEEMRTKRTAEALAVLTPEQQSQFTKMQGAPFNLDRSALYGGRGQGGPGGQGGGSAGTPPGGTTTPGKSKAPTKKAPAKKTPPAKT
jgi:hypothetical protein